MPLPPIIKHDRFWDMMQAAERYGFHAFWGSTSEWQAVMVAHMWLDNTEEMLKSYDTNPANFK